MKYYSTNDLINDVFDDVFSQSTNNAVTNVMKTDILEKEGNYILEIELPGCEKEAISIELKNGSLTIIANQSEKHPGCKVLRKERYTQPISRSFYVGKTLREEFIKASFNNGILTITFPKEIKEEPQRRIISID